MTRTNAVKYVGICVVASALSSSVLAYRSHHHESSGSKQVNDAQTTGNDATGIEAWLKGYDAAFVSKDLTRLATFYHSDVTIYEGAGVNNGWADYRDRHLGPELKAFENLEFGHSGTKVTVLPGGEAAYAISRYTIRAKMGDRMLDNEGLETLLLIKTPEGWKIRHSHTSGRPRRPAQ